MRVFLIPSSYPSGSNPIFGTFIEEQVNLLAAECKELMFGISLWGQGDEPYLLYANKPLRSLRKLFVHHPCFEKTEENKSILFSPAYTWSKKFRKGNLEGIIRANEQNLMAFIAKHGKPDLIHAQASYPAAWISKILSKKYKVPYLVTLRMSPFPFDEYLERGELNKDISTVLKQAKTLIATSRSQALRAESLGLGEIKVVHNPVDLNFFKPPKEKRPNAQVKLLAVGRLEAQKGFDTLIEAMSHVSEKIKLEIVGEGSQRKLLQRRIEDRSLNHRVRLVGQYSRLEIANSMQQADGYVLSSRHETFGNVLLEAMASGIPSVATRCGGPEDIISGRTGIFCEVNDEVGLAVAIEKMINTKWDPILIRSEAFNRFSPAVFATQMLDIYKQVSNT